MELGEEVHELVLVAQQDVQYRLRFVRICDEDLKMGSLVKWYYEFYN